ncbi:MAG TPA: cytochrome c oxidase subunit 3 [Gemmatimonadales bacterium]|jgi:heme/copper-type cytochrome/quinol oxidase subunit 3
MTSATLARPAFSDSVTTRPPGWWGMVCLIVTEAMVFACFFISYLYLWGTVDAFAAEGGHYPSITLTLPMTFILLASSVAMHWGERGIRRGDQRRLKLGMAISWLLGAAFLALQAVEYAHRTATPRDSAYQSLFYTITGTHGAHVLVGLLMSGVIQLRAWLGHFDAKRHLAVQTTAMYWHFVDGVWLFVFGLLYISPRLWHG